MASTLPLQNPRTTSLWSICAQKRFHASTDFIKSCIFSPTRPRDKSVPVRGWPQRCSVGPDRRYVASAATRFHHAVRSPSTPSQFQSSPNIQHSNIPTFFHGCFCHDVLRMQKHCSVFFLFVFFSVCTSRSKRGKSRKRRKMRSRRIGPDLKIVKKFVKLYHILRFVLNKEIRK